MIEPNWPEIYGRMREGKRTMDEPGEMTTTNPHTLTIHIPRAVMLGDEMFRRETLYVASIDPLTEADKAEIMRKLTAVNRYQYLGVDLGAGVQLVAVRDTDGKLWSFGGGE